MDIDNLTWDEFQAMPDREQSATMLNLIDAVIDEEGPEHIQEECRYADNLGGDDGIQPVCLVGAALFKIQGFPRNSTPSRGTFESRGEFLGFLSRSTVGAGELGRRIGGFTPVTRVLLDAAQGVADGKYYWRAAHLAAQGARNSFLKILEDEA